MQNAVPAHNIVFAADSNYLPHLAVALLSMIDNNRRLELNVHVLNNDISQKDWKKLLQLTKNSSAKLFDIKIQREEYSDLPTSGHLKLQTWYRLSIPDVLNVKKALYLDSDIEINGSLIELLEYDLGDYYLAAVEEPGDPPSTLGLQSGNKYFNAGVMLFNLDAWRRHQVSLKALSFAMNFPDRISWADQCALNYMLQGRWLSLPEKFNYQKKSVELIGRSNTSKEMDIYHDNNPVIVHYNGSVKPWHILSDHPFKKLYWDYRKKTSWNSLFFDDDIKGYIHFIYIKLVPKNLKNFIIRIKN